MEKTINMTTKNSKNTPVEFMMQIKKQAANNVEREELEALCLSLAGEVVMHWFIMNEKQEIQMPESARLELNDEVWTIWLKRAEEKIRHSEYLRLTMGRHSFVGADAFGFFLNQFECCDFQKFESTFPDIAQTAYHEFFLPGRVKRGIQEAYWFAHYVLDYYQQHVYQTALELATKHILEQEDIKKLYTAWGKPDEDVYCDGMSFAVHKLPSTSIEAMLKECNEFNGKHSA